jgi:hypothetical protein
MNNENNDNGILDHVVLNDEQKKLFEENKIKIQKLNDEKDGLLEENKKIGFAASNIINELDNLNNKIYKNSYDMMCFNSDLVKYIAVEYRHIIIRRTYDRIEYANSLLKDNALLIKNAEVLKTLCKNIKDDILNGLVDLNLNLLNQRTSLLKHYIHILKKLNDIQLRKRQIKKIIHRIRWDFKVNIAKTTKITDIDVLNSKEYEIIKKISKCRMGDMVGS